jgi:response regulator RpfG family c-di-GMP phosphodiesterase
MRILGAWPKEKALVYIQEQAGKKFDTQVVKAFLPMVQSTQENFS